jgi:3-isopropylmalate/(R)-2-methylmalate dehydratase small subunit
VDNTDAGDILQIELETGIINNITKGKTFKAKPYPRFMSEIISSGGLVEYTKKKIAGSVK